MGSGLLAYPGKLKPPAFGGHIHQLDRPSSGLLAYPGKLKLRIFLIPILKSLGFRITRLSGEVETQRLKRSRIIALKIGFRITRLSGEVETRLCPVSRSLLMAMVPDYSLIRGS